MRKYLFGLLLTFFSVAVFSQSSSVKGTIRDTVEKKNLSNAVVSVLGSKDSILVKFTRTDSHGAFAINNVSPGDYILLITYPKFADYADKITVSSTPLNLGDIPLTPKSVLLQEVVIRNNAAIRVKGDTTEFTADSFKVKEGATVEELLKQIPGMQVNSKGEITSQGKKVDKVLVDGEEFFGEDPTIATQNIGAKAVDKVQVFDTKTEQDQLKGIGASGDGNKTINIKLKESAKKGYFGTVEGGTDFDGIVNGKVMFNKFRGNKKVSVYGTKSNTNTGSLGWEEKNKLGLDDDNTEYDEISGYYYSYGDDNDDFNDWNLRGIPTAYTGGALFSNKWNEEKNKLNLSYLYNRLGTTNTTTTISQTLLEDTTFYNNSTSKSDGLSQQHALNGKYEWKIDSLTSIKYTVAGTYKLKDLYTESSSEALNEFRDTVNANHRINDNSSTKKQLDNLITYKQLFHKKDRQLIATLRLGIVDDDQTGKLLSTTDFHKVNGDSIDLIDQLKTYTGTSTTTGTKITYNEPLSKEWNVVAEYSLNYNHSISHRNSFNKDPNLKYTDLDTAFSNNFDLRALANSGTLTARYVGKKLRVAFGTGLSAIQLKLDDLDESSRRNYHFTGFTPQAQFGYKIKPQTGISFSYRGNTVQPTITQLQPLRNNSDPLSIYIGNPDLKVGFNHSLNLNFNDFKVLKGRYLFGNVSVNFMKNAITNQSTVDSFGKTTYVPVNVNGNNTWFFWCVWGSGQGDKKLIHEIQPGANGGRTVNFLNGKMNVNTYAYLSLSYRLRYSVTEKYNFSVGPIIKRNTSKSSLRPTANNNYWNYGGQADGYVKLPGKLELSSDIDLNLQPKTAAFDQSANIIVWNAELSRKFTKNKAFKIAIVAHDILNQNIGFNRTINSNFINEERFDRISRYFLLTASWTFNKMPGKN